MSRFLTGSLTLLLALMLAACGSDASDGDGSGEMGGGRKITPDPQLLSHCNTSFVDEDDPNEPHSLCMRDCCIDCVSDSKCSQAFKCGEYCTDDDSNNPACASCTMAAFAGMGKWTTCVTSCIPAMPQQ